MSDEPNDPLNPELIGSWAAPYTGFTPHYDYSAFDTQREQNPGKSAKDAFAYLSNQAPAAPFQDKAALGQWFEQYIRPGMDALGHHVSGVDGDTFSYGNHEGNFTVDYAQNAGAAPGSMLQRLQWGASPMGGAPQAQAAPSNTGGARAPVNTKLPVPSGEDDLIQQIIQAIEAQTPDVDPQARLQEQLR